MMLAFNVAQLLKEGVGASRQRELSGEVYDVDENNPGALPVVGKVTLVRTPGGILVTGEAELTLAIQCRRCLELTLQQVTLEIEDEFVPHIDVLTGRPLPVGDDVGPELVIDDRHTLDLADILWQYAVAQTMRPVYCSQECKGLCPYCGANLNLGPCDCDTRQIDPRLEALSRLLGSSDQDETTVEGEDQ
jgi:uncharacterized protein